MVDTEYLERIIKNSGLKKEYISKMLGITRYGLRKKIKNETEFKASEINILSEVLNIRNFEDIKEIFLISK